MKNGIAATSDSGTREDSRITSKSSEQRTRSTHLDLLTRRRRDGQEILARVDEAISLGAVLLVVQLAIATAESEQFAMRPALDDDAIVEHKNLVGALDRRKPMRNDERRSAATE